MYKIFNIGIEQGGMYMNSCEFLTFISVLASSIAKNKTQDEVNLLAVFFTQLGDTLATISTFEGIKDESKKECM